MRLAFQTTLAFAGIGLLAGAGFYAAFQPIRADILQQAELRVLGIAREIARDLDAQIHLRLVHLALIESDAILQDTIETSNAAFAILPGREEYIRRVDADWRAGRDTPEIRPVLDNASSRELRAKIEALNASAGHPELGELYATNRYGLVVAASGRTSDYLQADEDWYAQATAQERFWVGGVEYDASSRAYSMDLVRTLRDAEGRPRGVLKATLNIAALRNYLDAAREHLPWPGAAATLVDRQGVEIFSVMSGADAARADVGLAAYGAKHPMAEALAVGRDMLRSPGAQGGVLTAIARSPGYADYPGTGWALFLDVPAASLTGDVERILRLLIHAYLAACVLAPVIAYSFVARVFVRRVKALQKGAAAVAGGHFDQAVAVPGRDELAKLGAVFNAMREKLQAHVQRASVHAATEAALAAEQAHSRELAREVAARRQAETALKIASLAFDNAADAHLVTDPEGRIVQVNAAFTQITGYSEAEVLGQNPRILKSGRQDAGFYRILWQDISTRGHWEGEIWDRRKDGGIYPKWMTINAIRDDEGAITHYVAVFSDITQRKQAEAEMYALATTDSLTGALNRRMFEQALANEMAAARRYAKPLALIMCDIDHFKHVNDTYGHAAGDTVLRSVAAIVKRNIRAADVFARWGGEEFMILTPQTDVEQARVLAEKLREAIGAAVFNPAGRVSASFGVTLFAPQDDADSLVRRADGALYDAKIKGRNRVAVLA